jgi:hypothetical protein
LLRNQDQLKPKIHKTLKFITMRKFRAGIIAGVILAVISLAACKKNGSSPSPTTPQLGFQLKAVNASTTLASAPGANKSLTTNSAVASIAGLTWSSGIANISRFKLEAKKNGIETEITSKNLTNVDLFALSPSIINVTLDTGTYKEIEIRVELQMSADTSMIPLRLKGSFTTSGGTVIPIEFDLNDNVTIKAEAENIAVSSTTDFVALVQMRLDKLEAGVTAADLDAATLTNGVIVISNNSNTSIYNKVLSNFSSCGESKLRDRHNGEGGDGGNNGNDGMGHN